jgi:hypothetical protein
MQYNYDFSDLDEVDDILGLMADQNWSPHKQLAWLAWDQGLELDPRVGEYSDHLLARAIEDGIPLKKLVDYLQEEARRERAKQAEDERQEVAEASALQQRRSERDKCSSRAKRIAKAAKPTDPETQIIALFRAMDLDTQTRLFARLQLEQDNSRAQQNKAAVAQYGHLWEAARTAARKEGGKFPPAEVIAVEYSDFADRMEFLDWYVTAGVPESGVSDDVFVAVARECIETLIWYQGKKRGRSAVSATMVLDNIPQLQHFMDHGFPGLWEGRMLHWVATA